VVAADTAYFADVFHFINDVIPGDGSHIIWPLLLGLGRARYFLMTGQKIFAEEAKQIGFVHEILPPDAVLDRAWEIARDLCQYSDVTLRNTRLLFAQQFRRHLVEELPLGLALEGLGFCNYFPSKMKQF
jgi:enoyl-CoA hydratase/carnithine racemase